MNKVLLVLILLSWPVGFPQGAFQGVSITGERESSLDAWYRSYDHSYFNDELPTNTIITRTLNDDRFMALTDYEGAYHISLNPKYGPSQKQERETLLHEMCHIRQMVSKEDDEFDDHGPKWQSCMHTLANQGAFEDLW